MSGENRDSFESTVDEFLELEEQLGERRGATGRHEQGTIDGATKVPAHEIPDDYPWGVDTEEALRLDVGVDGGLVTVYLSWPEEGTEDTHTEDLLDALGYDPGQFANLYGEEVALAHDDGWHRVDLRRTGAKRVGEQETDADLSVELIGVDLSVEPSEAVILAGIVASVSLFFTPTVVADLEESGDLFSGLLVAGIALTGGGIF